MDGNAMSTSDPARIQAAIREGYLRYFDTAFWLRDEKLMAERRRLLEQDGHVFQDALIEPCSHLSARVARSVKCAGTSASTARLPTASGRCSSGLTADSSCGNTRRGRCMSRWRRTTGARGT